MSGDGKADINRATTDLPPIPQGWSYVHLGEIADIASGITKGQRHHPGTDLREVPYLRVANVQRGFLDLQVVSSIAATEDKINALRLRPGDVLFTEGGDRDKLGRGWVWSGEIEECIHQNHIFRARLLSSDINSKLVSYHGNSFGRDWFLRNGKQTTNLASINQTVLRRFPVPVPPANEQHRIVEAIESYLTRLDDAVASLERVQRNLKRYRASVLKAAVEGRLVPTEAELARSEGRDYEPASVLLDRILKQRRHRWIEDAAKKGRAKAEEKAKKAGKPWTKKDNTKTLEAERAKAANKYKQPAAPDTEGLPKLPEGWCWATVAQMGCVQLGRQRSPKNRSKDYPTKYIRAANITESGIDVSDVLDMEFKPPELARYRMRKGDIVVSEASGSPDQVGKPAVWNDEIPVCCFQNTVIRLRPEGANSEYLLVVFKHCYSNKVFAKIAGGVGINHLSAAKFSKVAVPLAPQMEQGRVAEEVERQLSVARKSEELVETTVKRAQRLRQSILKWAFEGKLVDQDPNDEPATVLLERIQAERAAMEATNTKEKRRQRKSK